MYSNSEHPGNEDGFSFVEVLISLVLVVSVLGSLAMMGHMNRDRVHLAVAEMCEQTVRASMDNLRSVGAESAFVPLDYNNFKLNYDPQNPPQTPFASGQVFSYPANKQSILTGTPGNYKRNTIFSFIGSMSMLADLYNQQNGTYCDPNPASPGGLYPTGNLLLKKDVAGQFDSVTTKMKIERYNLQTGAKNCSKFFPAPRGSWTTAKPTTAYGISDYDSADPNYNIDYNSGFWVTLTTTYQNEKKETKSCSTSGLFQYPRLSATTMGVTGSFIFGAISCGSPAATSANLHLYMNGVPDPEKQGWVAMCKDQSHYPNNGADWTIAHEHCPQMGYGGSPNLSDGGAWAPCSRLRICNLQPVSSHWSSSNQLDIGYTGSAPVGCVADIQVQIMDAAGNVMLSPASITGASNSPSCGLTPCPQSYIGPGYCPQLPGDNSPPNCVYVPPFNPGDGSPGPDGGYMGDGDGGSGHDGNDGDGDGNDGDGADN